MEHRLIKAAKEAAKMARETAMNDYDELLKRLTVLEACSCSCGTKTPDPAWHDAQCHYRGHAEAGDAIRSLQAKLDAIQPRPIEESINTGLYVYAFHRIWKCWIAVQWCDGAWIEKTLTTKWPPEAFSQFIPFSALAALEQKP